MSKKSIVVFFFLLGIVGCGIVSKKKIEIEELKEIDNIITTRNFGLIYTSRNKSYKIVKSSIQLLENKIIDKFYSFSKEFYIIEEDKKKGVMDQNQRIVLGIDYDNIEILGEDLILAETKSKKFFIDLTNFDIKGPYDSIYPIGNGKILRVEKNGEEKYVDKYEQEIIELKGKTVLYCRDSIVVTEKKGYYGLYNLITNEYILEENEEIYFSIDNILRKRDGKYYFNNNEIEIKKFYPSRNDVIVYETEGGFGLFNLKKGKFYKETYDEIAPNYDKFIIVGKDGKYGVTNKDVENKTKYLYDYITKVGTNSFAAGTDKTGLFALIVKDKQITDEKFERIIEINKNYFLGEKENTYILLNRKGYEIFKTAKNNIKYSNEIMIVVQEGQENYVYSLEGE